MAAPKSKVIEKTVSGPKEVKPIKEFMSHENLIEKYGAGFRKRHEQGKAFHEVVKEEREKSLEKEHEIAKLREKADKVAKNFREFKDEHGFLSTFRELIRYKPFKLEEVGSFENFQKRAESAGIKESEQNALFLQLMDKFRGEEEIPDLIDATDRLAKLDGMIAKSRIVKDSLKRGIEDKGGTRKHNERMGIFFDDFASAVNSLENDFLKGSITTDQLSKGIMKISPLLDGLKEAGYGNEELKNRFPEKAKHLDYFRNLKERNASVFQGMKAAREISMDYSKALDVLSEMNPKEVPDFLRGLVIGDEPGYRPRSVEDATLLSSPMEKIQEDENLRNKLRDAVSELEDTSGIPAEFKFLLKKEEEGKLVTDKDSIPIRVGTYAPVKEGKPDISGVPWMEASKSVIFSDANVQELIKKHDLGKNIVGDFASVLFSALKEHDKKEKKLQGKEVLMSKAVLDHIRKGEMDEGMKKLILENVPEEEVVEEEGESDFDKKLEVFESKFGGKKTSPGKKAPPSRKRDVPSLPLPEEGIPTLPEKFLHGVPIRLRGPDGEVHELPALERPKSLASGEELDPKFIDKLKEIAGTLGLPEGTTPLKTLEMVHEAIKKGVPSATPKVVRKFDELMGENLEVIFGHMMKNHPEDYKKLVHKPLRDIRDEAYSKKIGNIYDGIIKNLRGHSIFRFIFGSRKRDYSSDKVKGLLRELRLRPEELLKRLE